MRVEAFTATDDWRPLAAAALATERIGLRR
jgi:hypothetical protein